MKRPFAALTLLILSIVFILSVLWFCGRPAYRRHSEKRAVSQARHFITDHDPRNASLSLRRALLLNPNNIEACSLMAELSEQAGAPQAVEWRRKIAGLSATVENRVKLAATSTRFEPPPCAESAKILSDLSTTGRELPQYHVLRAELALKCNRLGEAEACFQEALRLAPGNQAHQFNLAVLRLRSTNELIASEARLTLQQMTTNNFAGLQALRALSNDAVSRTNWIQAETIAGRIEADPRSDFNDRLQHLTILRRTSSERLDVTLQRVQQQAQTNLNELPPLCSWIIENGMATNALQWLKKCPANLSTQLPYQLAVSECQIALEDWTGLQTTLESLKWTTEEHLRLAHLSLAARKMNQETVADARWRLAIRAAAENPEAMMELNHFAQRWGWTRQREDLLWLVVDRSPRERWAYAELDQLYTAAGNTRGLRKLYSSWSAREPLNALAKNNLAVCSLLLSEDLTHAHAIAKENYEKHSQEPVIASTYALSLHLQNRTKEALEILEKLSPEALESPSVALYYGFLLRSSGAYEKAARYLAVVNLDAALPEERKLLERVTQDGSSG